MPEQLVFELGSPASPTFANFVAGPNAEAVASVRRIATHETLEQCVLLWGAAGAGKSHLLRAAAEAASASGRHALYCSVPVDAPRSAPSRGALVAIDAIDTADAAAQARLFTLYNELVAAEGQLIAAAGMPPARMPLRDDLRTRLGWGLVYEIVPLADADKAAALSAFAHERGFRLGDDVIAYLLSHGRRDMASLVGMLLALDRHSLAVQRPITVPLIRELLQRELWLPPRP